MCLMDIIGLNLLASHDYVNESLIGTHDLNHMKEKIIGSVSQDNICVLIFKIKTQYKNGILSFNCLCSY